MKKDEILELSKMKSKENCCVFCESKCDKCGSVNILVKYYRFYKFDDKKMIFQGSFAEVCCHECGDSAKREKLVLPGLLDGIEVYTPTFNKKLSLGKKIDYYFEDEDLKQISSEMKARIQKEGIKYFQMVFEYENIMRDQINMELYESYCLDEMGESENSEEIAKILDSMLEIDGVLLDCSKKENDDPESHYVVHEIKFMDCNN